MRLPISRLTLFVPLLAGCNLVLGLGDYKESNGSGATGGGGGTPLTCGDGKRDGNETDLDCGGDCGPCDPGQGCVTSADCTTKVCNAQGACAPASCTDTIKNGDEVAVDCGGSCAGCAEGSPCLVPTDCKSGQCTAGKCAASCTDQAQNGNETGIDCGGSCNPCPIGGGCTTGADCQSQICVTGTCSNGHLWSKAFGSPAGMFPQGGLVAIAPQGDILFGGTLGGAVDFGGGVLTPNGIDAAVARFSPNGTHLMSKALGFTGNQLVGAVAADPTTGEMAMGGSYTTALDFGNGSWPAFGGSTLLDTDIYFARISSAGLSTFDRALGSASKAESTRSVAIDAAGNFFAGGQYSGNCTIDGKSLIGGGNGDMFLLKYSKAGVIQWAKGYADGSNQSATSIAMAPMGRLVVAGNNSGTINFGGASVSSAAGDADVFLATLDTNGNHVWSHEFGDTMNQGNPVLAVSAQGDIILAGEFQGTITFGASVLTSAGGTDIFVAKLTSQGVPVWAKSFGDASEQLLPRVAVDDQGNVLLGCSGNGQIDFGGGALVSAGGPTGGEDAFLAKLRGSDGSHVWSTRFGDTHIQGISSIASAGGDEIVFTAGFDGTVNFGGSDFTNVGPQDVALVRYATPHPN